MKNFTQNIKHLFNYTCNIFELKPINDSNSKKTYFEKFLVYENIPCRISYISSSSTNYINKTDFNNKSLQYVKLFLENNILIKPGSIVTIFKDSFQIATFKNSGNPKIYSFHQEITLSLEENFF